MTSLTEELTNWAQERPAWQRRVMSRIADGEKLGQADYRQIASLLARGDCDSDSSISFGEAAAVREARPAVRLLEVETGKSVNALAHGQKLTFGPEGLTVVYGDNGSGKSGYARLLKQVVGARVQEEVLSNIFLDRADSIPGAEIVYSICGVKSEPCDWHEVPHELKRISFFDQSCGDAFVTTASEVTFRPAALYILDALIEACDGIRQELDLLLRDNERQSAPLPVVSKGGAAAQFLAQLSGTTSKAEIESACEFDSSAEGRIAKLKKLEAQLKSSDPAEERNRLNDLATRYELVANHLSLLSVRLAPDVINDVAEKRRLARELRAAATIAAQETFESEPVSGVGSDTWRTLWEAARSFSETEAFVGETFPMVDQSAKCVLCQQELDDNARSRFRRFEASVRDETERRAGTAEAAVDAAVTRVRAIEVAPATVLAAFEILGPSNPALLEQCRTAVDSFATVAQAIAHGKEIAVTDNDQMERIENSLLAKSAQLRSAASTTSDSQYDKRLRDITDELTKLEDAALMNNASSTILREVSRLNEQQTIEEAKRGTNTAAITRKSTEFTRAFVTSQIQDRFATELHRLRLPRVVLSDVGGQKGQLRKQPAFDGAVQHPDIDKVLSEGEQRALGLAGFFTEASLDSSKSALVLDDPVSSLDHVHRDLVATRLAEYAAERQVIVFTHDLAFVSELHRATVRSDIAFVERTVERQQAGGPGVCLESHPWKAKAVTARLGDIKADLSRVKKTLDTGSQEEQVRVIADWSGKLSETWERIISETITSPLFDPGTQQVSPNMLKLFVQINEGDNKEFQESYSRISRWARRHDKSLDTNFVPPEVDELSRELELVKAWFDRVRKYRS
ncbi:MAG: AAA family ATPase [Chloroflexi bacterium]|nr:AAA family ATPase [Chloroflexota bacterium]